MEEVSWETAFKGKLNVVLDDNKQIELFSSAQTELSVFAMQAIRTLMNEFLTGAEIVKNWRIKRFSQEEGILEIEKIKA